MIEKEVFIKDGKVISADDVYLDPRDATIQAQAAEIERLRTMVEEQSRGNMRLNEKIRLLREALSAIECYGQQSANEYGCANCNDFAYRAREAVGDTK